MKQEPPPPQDWPEDGPQKPLSEYGKPPPPFLPEPMPEPDPNAPPPPVFLPEPMPEPDPNPPPSPAAPVFLPEPMPEPDPNPPVPPMPSGMSPTAAPVPTPLVGEATSDIALVGDVVGAGPNGPASKPASKLTKPGCLAIPAVLVLIILVAWVYTDNKDPVSTGSPVPSELTDDSSSDSSSSVSALGPDASPPSADALQPGELLFQGQSGDNIGYIAQDGASRFLSITGPGVGFGDPSRESKSITWDKTGRITGFGVTLATDSNKGRYGVNIFVNGTAYNVGCALEVGQTSCLSVPANLAANPPLNAGDRVTIIIGEQGHTEAHGDFPLSWWFTFKPS